MGAKSMTCDHCSPFRCLADLRKDRKGSILTWVAVSIIPLLVSVGMAVDMTRGYVMRSKLATALDAAALAGGRVFNLPTRDADVQSYFDANFPAGLMKATIGPLVITPIQNQNEPERLRVSAAATIPTVFMKLVGIDEMAIATESEVTRENLGLQLVMVLDVTGSMATGGKIGALRSASENLINILFGGNGNTSDKLSVAIVPYSQAVNVGDLGDDFIDWSYLPASLRNHPNSKRRWAGCVQARPTPGVLSNDKTELEADAYDANLAPASGPGGKWKPYISPHWNNIGANPPNWRDNQYQQIPFDADMDPTNPGFEAPAVLPYVADPASYRSGEGPNGENFGLPNGTTRGPNINCPSRLLDFTNVKSQLNSYIGSQLNPAGWTIGNQGLVWGWRLLDPSTPFPNPVPYNDPQTIKSLIMMTDGVNEIGTTDYTAYGRLPWNRLGVTTPTAAANEFDKRIAKICHAMKAGGVNGRDKVEVYTVVFGGVATSGNSQAQALRQIYTECASRPANAFMAPSNNDLQAAFRTIGNDLANLHLSR